MKKLRIEEIKFIIKLYIGTLIFTYMVISI